LLFRDIFLGQWGMAADYFEDDILYGVIPVLFADKGVRESALKGTVQRDGSGRN
jgi:hypothetical protein